MNKVIRKFHIGSEWLYLKIYTNEIHSDNILLSAILPCFYDLKKKNIVDEFFFIRYNDPDFHLRVRFKLKDKIYAFKAVESINFKIRKFIKNEYIWKTVIDTYERELHRYGNNNIEFTETLFFVDSLKVLNILKKIDKENLNEDDKMLMSIKLIKMYLNLFNLNSEQKIKLFSHMSSSFHLEFNSDSTVKKRINQYYQNLKKNELNIIKIEFSKKELISLKHLIDKIFNNLKADRININDYLFSIIHMNCNRFFNDNNRRMELIIYDVLLKELKSEFYKTKA